MATADKNPTPNTVGDLIKMQKKPESKIPHLPSFTDNERLVVYMLIPTSRNPLWYSLGVGFQAPGGLFHPKSFDRSAARKFIKELQAIYRIAASSAYPKFGYIPLSAYKDKNYPCA